jgi:quercetin dioxygenase-like cupin family protein
MVVVRGDSLSFIETPGRNAGAGLATATRGASETSVIRQRQEPGGTNPAHFHDREEVMLLLAGRISVTMAGETLNLTQGDTLIVPPRTEHRIENAGDEPAEWLLIAPAGVRFFHANGEEASPPWAR